MATRTHYASLYTSVEQLEITAIASDRRLEPCWASLSDELDYAAVPYRFIHI